MLHRRLFAEMNSPDVVSAKAEALRQNALLPDEVVLVTPGEAADLIGISAVTLAQWRSADEGPPYSKIGRDVRYDLAKFLAFIEQRRAWLERMA